MLRIVMTNLISNAVKFTAHEKQARIEIGSKEPSGRKSRLSVLSHNSSNLSSKKSLGRWENSYCFFSGNRSSGSRNSRQQTVAGRQHYRDNFQNTGTATLGMASSYSSGNKKIYIVYNPEDPSPVLALKMIQSAASELGVEILSRQAKNDESLKNAISNIPAEADAVFMLPDSFVSTRLYEFAENARNLRLPTSVTNFNALERNGILTSFGMDTFKSGRQAARLANQILNQQFSI